jgi:hypothetical protein
MVTCSFLRLERALVVPGNQTLNQCGRSGGNISGSLTGGRLVNFAVTVFNGGSMRHLLITASLTLFGLTSTVFGGGPDVRTKNATVESVISDDAKIVMIVSGRCELFLSDSALPAEKGNAKFVETDMRHCVVTIMRRDISGSGYENWDAHCENAKSLIGKSAWMDLQGSITVDRSIVAAVRAHAATFGIAEASKDSAKP